MQTMKSEEKHIEVPGGQIFVSRWWPTESSDKPAIVLLHDSLGCVALWRDFPAQLAEKLGREVVAYDRLGFGRSSVVPEPPSLRFIDEEAESVFPALCSSLGLEAVVPFGHSVGGGMAIAIASIHSQSNLCASVVTESAQAFVEERTRQGIEAAKKFFNQPGHLDKLSKYHGEKARWVLEAWTETWLHPNFADWSLRSHLKNVSCPVLAIHGDTDEYGSVAFPKLIAEESLGRSQALVLEGFGHVPHKENPGVVLAATERFLSEIEEPSVVAAGA
ncbi:putative hydrolase [Alcanivorax sp. NBRC 101098]|uniref:alpha/beta fold hydrolase n=1 Tax=Alcanivorax sp. NBRC 101098 TaxID=1113728 RepID=UPI0004ABDD30|nr:alpha/beta hydrolase [Alcanivorax sp. NBRC 101098]BAP13644.1 putative hydrolase [Alcanivorax sp. NBRC 101098]